MVTLAGCGTYATPVFQAGTATPITVVQANSFERETAVPTETPTIEPTATIAPTDIPTDEPTPTEEPTEESVASPLDRLIASRDPAEGAILFDTFQDATGFACSTCHHVDSEQQLIGPGLLNIKDRAGSRIEGQGASEYLYNSIINPNEYIVEGFTEGVMPANWQDVYTDQEIFSIVAYLLTLEGEPDALADATTSDDSTTAGDDVSVDVIVLPDTADAEHGAELFTTFQADAGFACSTCHHADSEDRLIGPGLLNISSRADMRVDGQDAVTYIYTSIVNPSAFVVADYPDELMPANWAEIYTEEEIFDIIAYLTTLGDSPDEDSASTDEATATVVELPDTADAEHGAELFTTFQADAGFACSTCHQADSEDRLIGPGLLNIGSRADMRVDGQDAVTYIYTSIVNPSAFVVADYPDELMPANWAEIYTEEEIFDIIAYLTTLE